MGIDPSLNATGLALVDGSTATLKQKAADGDYRLVKIRCSLQGAIQPPQRPDLVVAEDLPRNAMGAGITGQVQGVMREVLQSNRVPYLLVSAATLKKFGSGSGRADKAQMRQAWLEYSGIDNPRDDEVDAAWLRELGLHLTGQLKHELPHWEASVANLRPAFDKLHLGAAHFIQGGPDFAREEVA
jgi:Holliday junction resolvasome RuvABC endonuclease subunit